MFAVLRFSPFFGAVFRFFTIFCAGFLRFFGFESVLRFAVLAENLCGFLRLRCYFHPFFGFIDFPRIIQLELTAMQEQEALNFRFFRLFPQCSCAFSGFSKRLRDALVYGTQVDATLSFILSVDWY